jgi:uncharacterized protein YndB with AHSA1/START domain
MKKIHFEIIISAKPEKVWNAIVTDAHDREWTKEFNPRSRFEGGWEKGEIIKFIGENEKGEVEGMTAEITGSRPPSFISIRHLGYIHRNTIATTSNGVKKWAPAYENYTLTPTNRGTRFEINADTEDQFLDIFNAMWPKALKRLKHIAKQ